MEAVFSRFDSYDFAADRRFEDGLKVLQQRPGNNDKVLDMKLFFYNSEHLADAAAETPSEAETEVTQLSFAEVMRLIQEGKEVPGALKLDIKPSNQSPTPSQMERVLKPWEV
ncbi:hypothetical protein INR49_003522, partial [Caranx melampygus]